MSYAFRHFYIVFSGDFTLRFSDPDDYMMLVRIRDFFVHGDFAYSLTHMVNTPFGVDIYWSRLYDFFLVIPIWFFNLFFDSIFKSIEYVCFVISPILNSILCIIVYKFFQKILKNPDAFLGALLFAIIPCFSEISEFGRPDHHVFITTLEIIYLYTLLNIIKNDFKHESDYIKSAVISALCIWSSTETLPLILISESVLFFFICNYVRKIEFLYYKTILTSFIIGIIVFLSFSISLEQGVGLIALLILVLSQIIWKNKSNDLYLALIFFLLFLFSADNSFAYDKISSMHLVLYLCASLYLLANIIFFEYVSKHIIKFSFFIGLIISTAFLYKYPMFLLGIKGGASEFLRNAWFPTIQDLSSPFYSKFISICFCCYSVIISISIYDKIGCLVNKKRENIDTFWWILVITSIVYFLFSCFSRRSIAFSSTIGLPLIVSMGLNGVVANGFSLSRKLRVFITCILVLLPSMAQKYYVILKDLLLQPNVFMQKIKIEHHRLQQEDKTYKFLDSSLGESSVVIISDPYSGPRILYHTKHKVVSVPFHSQEKGVIYSLIITQKPNVSEQEVKDILKSTNASYVFVKKTQYNHFEPYFVFPMRLEYGNLPDWIEHVNIPVENPIWTLAKIRKDKL